MATFVDQIRHFLWPVISRAEAAPLAPEPAPLETPAPDGHAGVQTEQSPRPDTSGTTERQARRFGEAAQIAGAAMSEDEAIASLARQLENLARSESPRASVDAVSLIKRSDKEMIAQALHLIGNDCLVAKLLLPFKETGSDTYFDILSLTDEYSPEDSWDDFLSDRVEKLVNGIYIADRSSLQDKIRVKGAVLAVMADLYPDGQFEPLSDLVGEYPGYDMQVISVMQDPDDADSFRIVASAMREESGAVEDDRDFPINIESEFYQKIKINLSIFDGALDTHESEKLFLNKSISKEK